MRFLLLLLLLPIGAFAQSNVGVGTSTPDGSAKLDVSSTTQGMLIPRMTEAQKNVISNPANGLLVYQTDATAGFHYYNGSSWVSLADNLGNHSATQILDMDTNKIVNVPTPVNGLDAVNKNYVDAAIASGGGGGGSLGNNMPTELSPESSATMNFGAAMVYCDTLTEGGNTDWIAPTSEQLTYAASGGCVVPGTRTANYLWTRTDATTNGYTDANRIWRLSDGNGERQYGWNSQKVRCVR